MIERARRKLYFPGSAFVIQGSFGECMTRVFRLEEYCVPPHSLFLQRGRHVTVLAADRPFCEWVLVRISLILGPAPFFFSVVLRSFLANTISRPLILIDELAPNRANADDQMCCRR